jgi:ribonuclease G
LLEKWNAIEKAKKESNKLRKVYEEPSLIEKSLRDFFTEDIDEVIIDDQENYDYIKNFTEKILGKKIAGRIIFHNKAEPIFEYYRIEEKISKIFERTVNLPSGGYICIDETEALIAIDVNTGSVRGQWRDSEVIFNTNMEAADEIAHQLRLRNIGGLVVIDFIDMDNPANNEQLLRKMRKLLKNDKVKANVLPISQFGLMQMTRKRDQQSLLDRVYDPCPYCKGTGKVKSPLSISVEIQRQLKELLKRKSYDKNLSVRVIMNPTVLARLKNEDERFLIELEDKYGKDLSFRADTMLHIEEFKIIDAVTAEELLC